MSIGEPWKTPIATKNVPAYRTAFVVATSIIVYPHIPNTQPPIMKYPRLLYLSEAYAVPRTVIKAAILGGTVKSCAAVDLYPIPAIMLGKNSEKLY
jgi:hypothetical protein